MVSEQLEISEGSTMAIEAPSQQSDLVSMRSDETMRRIEAMLAKMLAEKNLHEIGDYFQEGNPTPDPPDPPKTRQFNTQPPQPNNQGGQKSPGNLTSGSLKNEFPKLDGTLMREWVSRCDQFFYWNRTPLELMVRQASLHLEGKTLQWHLNYIRNRYGLYPSWAEYIVDISAQFGGEWDADVIDHYCWVESNGAIDLNQQSIDDLKEYGVVYTPMVIDDNQMVVKELADPIAHQVLDEMSAQNERNEIEQTELKESSDLNQDEEVLQIKEEDEPTVAKESTYRTAYQVFDEMSMHFEEVIEFSIDDTMGPETSLSIWDGLKVELKFDEVAGSSIDEDKLDGHERDLCFDPGGDLWVASYGCPSRLCFDPGGASMIFEGYFYSYSSSFDVAGLLEDSKQMLKRSELLMFNPGGSLVVSKALCSPIANADFIVPCLIECLKDDRHHIIAQCLVELLLYDSTTVFANVHGGERFIQAFAELLIHEFGVSTQLVFDPGGEEVSLFNDNFHELRPVPARKGEWQRPRVQPSVMIDLFLATWPSKSIDGHQFDFLTPTSHKGYW